MWSILKQLFVLLYIRVSVHCVFPVYIVNIFDVFNLLSVLYQWTPVAFHPCLCHTVTAGGFFADGAALSVPVYL